MLPVLAAGFGTGLSLIVAIGAQNTFVLQQGLRGGTVGPVVLVCVLSDVVLIAAGVAGIGSVLHRLPSAAGVIGVAGGLFLVAYGFLAARRAIRPGALTTGVTERKPLRRTVFTCLALTWLNPHVYLDTVLLLGSVATTHGDARWTFGAGAILASVLWFWTLGFGARRLAGVFARPAAWRVLDTLIAVTMTTLGVAMIAGQL